MQIHTSFETLKNVKNAVVAIGTFDGVHNGHMSIINRLKQSAAEKNGESVLLTFYPHPRMVLHPQDHGLQLLTTQDEKARLLKATGIDHLIVYPFTKEFSKLDPMQYVRDLLVTGIGAKRVVAGYDHRFGRNREGNLDTLRQLAEVFNFEVEEIPAHVIDEVQVSSTKIREALLKGDIISAKKFLGHSYTLSGTVVHGDSLGSQLGFPTANIKVDDPLKLVPRNGVYAVRVCQGEKFYAGALNIGVRPTVSSSSQTTIEVYIIDFFQDIYNETLQIEFAARIRDELKFGSIDELKTALEKDVKWTKDFFSKSK